MTVSPFPCCRWEHYGFNPTEFNWMSTGLGSNPTAAIYDEDIDMDLDEKVFEQATDETEKEK